MLRGPRELQHEVRWRESEDVVGGFVVLKIVVIILDEEHWRRTEFGPVHGTDLRAGRTLEHGLVIAAEHHARSVEPAGDPFGFRRSAIKPRWGRGPQIHVGVV